MIPLDGWFFLREFLAWEEFDDFPAGRRRLLNRFKHAEAIERIGLQANGESPGLVFVGNDDLGAGGEAEPDSRGDQRQLCANAFFEKHIHDELISGNRSH